MSISANLFLPLELPPALLQWREGKGQPWVAAIVQMSVCGVNPAVQYFLPKHRMRRLALMPPHLFLSLPPVVSHVLLTWGLGCLVIAIYLIPFCFCCWIPGLSFECFYASVVRMEHSEIYFDILQNLYKHLRLKNGLNLPVNMLKDPPVDLDNPIGMDNLQSSRCESCWPQ